MVISDYVAIIISFVIGAIIPILVIWINNKHEVKLFERQKKFELNKTRFDHYQIILFQLIESAHIVNSYLLEFFRKIDNYRNGNEEINIEYLKLNQLINERINSDDEPFVNFNTIGINLESMNNYFTDIKPEIHEIRRHIGIINKLRNIYTEYGDFSDHEAYAYIVELQNEFFSLPKIMYIHAEIMDSISQIEYKKCLEV